MDKKAVKEIRDAIVTAVLDDYDSQEGWTWEEVIRGGARAGYDEAVARAVFPGRLSGVLDAFADLADHAMLQALKKQKPDAMRVRDRIRMAVMARFAFLAQHKEAERAAITFHAFPFRKIAGARLLWRTADRIWDWAGDTATDYNRYTKRGLLCGVLASTALAFLGDDSENLRVTAEFLDRRIDNVMELGKVVGRFKKQAV